MTSKLYNLKIHSFVLMNNHFHLIASTPDANIDQCMHYFMHSTSLRLTRAGNRINGTYGSRYYKTILQCHNYYLNAYKYNYLNPLRANISSCVEDHPYSTLHGLLGKSKLITPVLYDDTLFSSVSGTLKWLNTIPDEEMIEAVRFALKKPYFKSKLSLSNKKPVLTENCII